MATVESHPTARMSSAGERRQQVAAEVPSAEVDDNSLLDPMDSLMDDPAEEETGYETDETDDELDVWDEETHNSSLRELTRLSRFVSMKLIVVGILMATSLGRDFLDENSPYISDLMGWSAPQCEFQIPATSRMRVAKFHANQFNHSGGINGSYELSNSNTSSIYPVRDVEQPNVLSEEFKVLVCGAGSEFNSTALEATELPPFISFPLEKNATSDTQNVSVALLHGESDQSAPTSPAQPRRCASMMVAAETIPQARNALNPQHANEARAEEQPKRRNRHKFDPNTHPAVLLARHYRRLNETRQARQAAARG